jgi:hypothetical protein
LRTLRDFAEAEIVIPDGPFEGRRFHCDRQPFTRLWFDGRWNRKFAPGCTQSGKSLTGFVIPILYHLFEMQETVIAGVPDMDMAADKWREDILPVIARTKYPELIPSKGPGSRGGKFDAIQFLSRAIRRKPAQEEQDDGRCKGERDAQAEDSACPRDELGMILPDSRRQRKKRRPDLTRARPPLIAKPDAS